MKGGPALPIVLLCAMLLATGCRSDPVPDFSEKDTGARADMTPPPFHLPLADWRRNHMTHTAPGPAPGTRIFSAPGCRDCHAPEAFCNRCHAFVGAPLMGD